MANVKISELTAATTLAATDQFEINAAGVSKSATAQKVLDLAASATQTLSNKTISGSSNTITNVSLTSGVTGTLPIANGGSGQTTATAAFNALAPSQTSNSGKFLTTDGTNTSWGTAGGSFILLATLTASNSATLQDTTNITSAYDDYFFVLDSLVPVTASTFRMRITVNAGSTWLSSGYSNPGQSAISAYFTLPQTATDSISTDTSGGINGTVHMFAVNASARKTIYGAFSYYNHNGGSPTSATGTAGGAQSTSSAVNGVQFYFGTGNVSSGSIKIYGIKK